MARITTRDCERVVPNRFELVLLAARRAHDLWNGAEPQVDPGDEKPTVLALREVAARRIDPDALRRQLIERFAALGTDAIDFGRPPVRGPAPSSPIADATGSLDGGAPAQVPYH
ncbi:DNA-directed RNA polymerase omega subunit [Microvirga flocculans]|uniref:DNA-directed RNA polymerase subunit omega n=1 Tax=Microvirga flocculans TaxID=217168 RepID=A0A7W6IEI0_9HYPH|nr:DNA-directed RNA polymerase subunit omega [Microvirga flocculans]MBB4039909.1 DNA-directed RNA polymerase omega subunit [Microvirga flocculans]